MRSAPVRGVRGVRAAAGASNERPIAVVGAGIAGLATAAALQRCGFKTVVLEQDNELRMEGAAIFLWANAWRALDAIGAAAPLRENYLSPDRCVGMM